MKKRMIAMLLCLVMVWGILPTTAFAADAEHADGTHTHASPDVGQTAIAVADTAGHDHEADAVDEAPPADPWEYKSQPGGYFSEGDGSSGTPYIIQTAQELANLAYAINHDDTATYSKCYYQFGADINLGGEQSWTPIGDASYKFQGHFDGAGFTVSGLYIDSDEDYQGLFGFIENATIQNLTVAGEVTGRANVGGIVGIAIGSTIANCVNTCTLSAKSSVGGIAGSIETGSTGVNCLNSGEIHVLPGLGYVPCGGGIAGTVKAGNVKNCVNTGAVIGDETHSYIGGIVGYGFGANGVVENCTSSGALSGADVGGIVGSLGDSFAVKHCYYTGASAVYGVDAGGGTATIENCLAYGDTTTADTITPSDAISEMNAWVAANGSDTYKTWILSNYGNYPTFAIWLAPTAAPTPTWAGSGTSNAPYIIKTAQELADLAYLVCKGTGYEGYYFELGNNINLGGQSWTPIGNSSGYFKATFDGAGHTVSGLYVNSSSDYAGLFGVIDAVGTVKNLTVSGEVTSTAYYMGGIVGVNYGKITNCTSYVDVTGEYGIGGIAGSNYAGTITGCTSYGDVKGTSGVGGIAGRNDGTIVDCTSHVDVTGKTSIGGIAGESSGTISGCENSGDVKGTSDVGGIVGFLNNGKVYNCFMVSGTVSGDTFVGGIVGYTLNTNIKNCYIKDTVASAVVGNGSGLYEYIVSSPSDTVSYYHEGEEKNYQVSLTSALNMAIADMSELSGVWTRSSDVNDGYPVFSSPLVYEDPGADYTFSGGSGLPENPYIIQTAQELFYLSWLSNNRVEDVDGKYYALGADIDLLGAPWTPIGDSVSFDAAFDGKGHTISGLFIYKGSNGLGLFGVVGSSGSVKNLAVSGEMLQASTQVGSIAGINHGEIANCTSDVNVTDCGPSGGIVGENQGSITGCTYSGTAHHAGGIAGINKGTIEGCENSGALTGVTFGGIAINNSGTIENCKNSGDLTYVNTNSQQGEIGGIAAYNSGTIRNCANSGDVEDSISSNSFTGGIVSKNEGGTVINCRNSGNVTATQCAGGIVARNNGGKVYNCYMVTGKVSGGLYGGAIIGTNDGTVINCYNTSDAAANTVGMSGGTVEYCYTVSSPSDPIGYYLSGGTMQLTTLGNALNMAVVDHSDLKSAGANAWAVVPGENEGYPVFTPFVYEDPGAGYTFSGSGQSGDPYIIQTAQELFYLSWLSNNRNADVDGKYYALGADIDLLGSPWTPIGQSSLIRFNAAFDGAGHTVSGLFVYRSVGQTGFFGHIDSSGSVQNLTLAGEVIGVGDYVGGIVNFNYGEIANCTSNVNVTGTGLYTGGIAGWNEGNLEGCESSGTVLGTSIVGGIAGNAYGTISDCTNSGNVTGTGNYVGGIVGNCSGDISGCENSGIVNGAEKVGGIAGNAYGTISDCTNSGDVTGTGNYVGGIVGNCSEDISGCENSGTVNGAEKVGGIAGWNEGNLEGCTNSGDVTGTNDIGGIAGYSAGTISDCTNSGNVTGTNSVGGIAGDNAGTITDCQNSGDVASMEYIGGIAGDSAGTISGCENSGIVNGAEKVGGIAGNAYGTISDCTNSGDVTGTNSVGGIAGESSGTIESCANGGQLQGDDFVGGIVGGLNASGSVINSYNTASVSSDAFVGGIAGRNEGALKNCYNIGAVSGSAPGGIAGSNAGVVESCYWLAGPNMLYTGNYSSVIDCDSFADENDTVLFDGFEVSLFAALDRWATMNAKNNWHVDSAVNGGYPVLLDSQHDSTFQYSLSADGTSIIESCGHCGHEATATLVLPSDLIYDGYEKKATVEYSPHWLAPRDTEVIFDGDTINAGNVTATLTIHAVRVAVTYTILPKVITAPRFEVASAQYTGQALEPTVTLLDPVFWTTIPASEYTVTYTNNINAGTGTITITDVDGGNYTVSGSTTFEIQKGIFPNAGFTYPISIMTDGVRTDDIEFSELFGGTTIPAGAKIDTIYPPSARVVMDGVYFDADNKITFISEDHAVGTTGSETYRVVVSSNNYENFAILLEFSLKDKVETTITGVSAVSGLVYNGQPQEGYSGIPTSDYGNMPEDYEILYIGTNYESSVPPTDAGTYTVVIRVPNTNTPYKGEIRLPMTIERAPLTPSLVSANTAKPYDGTNLAVGAWQIELNAVLSGDDVSANYSTLTYNSANVAEANTVTAGGIVLGGEDIGNYVLSTDTASTAGSITKSDPTVGFESGYDPDKIYDGEGLDVPGAIDLTLGGVTYEELVFTWYDAADGSALSGAPVNAGEYHLIVSVPNTTNTNTASSMPFTVNIAKGTYTGTVKGDVSVVNEDVREAELTISDLFGLTTIPEGAKIAGVKAPQTASVMTSVTRKNDGAITYVSKNNPEGTAGSDVYQVEISTTNYANFFITVTFRTVDKTRTDILVTEVNTSVYNGQPQSGYTGKPTGDYQGEYEFFYSGLNYASSQPPIDAGTYTVTIRVPASDLTYKGEIRFSMTIEKAAQTAPTETSSVKPTYIDKHDGMIMGVTAEMEYRKDGETSYTAIVGTNISGLAAGTYFVRYAETDNHQASPDVVVVIEKGAKYTAEVYDLSDLSKVFDGAAVIAPQYTYIGDGNIIVKWYSDRDGVKGDELSAAPTNAGAYWVGVSAAEGDTYEAASEATKRFTIAQAVPTVGTKPAPSRLIYGNAISKSTLTGGEMLGVNFVSLQGVYTWEDMTFVPTGAGKIDVAVVFTPNDPNYIAFTFEVEVEVVACDTPSGEHRFTSLQQSKTEHWYICSVCGTEMPGSRVGHSYDNACDTDCNVCHEVRITSHVFTTLQKSKTEHWYICAICATEKIGSRVGHSYDNACDTDCNVCYETRTTSHTFTTLKQSKTEHWYVCAICATEQIGSRVGHTYDNACDPTCNVCFEVRTITHRFTELKTSATEHWYICSICDKEEQGSRVRHSGGVATCTEKAVCTTCHISYGSVDDSNHAYASSWTKTADEHYYACSRCGEKKDRDVHGYDNACDATCNTCGYERSITHRYTALKYSGTEHWYVCSVCGSEKSGSREVHSGGTATCSARAICSECDQPYGSVDSSKHNANKQAGTPETCCANGTKEHWHCADCNKDFAEAACKTDITGNLKIPATGLHTDVSDWKTSTTKHWHICKVGGTRFDESNHIPGKPATADTPQLCTVCQYQIAPALGHSHGDGILQKGTAGDCETPGSKDYYICSCGAKFYDAACKKLVESDDDLIITVPHDFENGSIEKDASGHWRICKNCGAADTKQNHASAADDGDCTTPVLCSCGYVLTEAKAAHTGGEATCLAKAVCDVCGKAYGEIHADNHTKTTYLYTANADGLTHTKKHECCGATADAAEAHTYGADDKCICGAEKSGKPAPTYTVTVENGTVGGNNDTSVVVNENGSVTVTANTAPESKVFKGWAVNGEIVSDSETYTFHATENVTLEAVYEDVVDWVSPEDDGLSVGAIIGIVSGSLLLLVLILFIILWFVIKKKTWEDLVAVFKK